jgi:hypothetical protein
LIWVPSLRISPLSVGKPQNHEYDRQRQEDSANERTKQNPQHDDDEPSVTPSLDASE